MYNITMPKFQKFEQSADAYLVPPVLKNSFKAVYQILKDNEISSVLDIGCATGDFLNFLPPRIRGVGIDKSAALISEAKKRVKKTNISFIKTDILDKNASREFKKQFDAVTILGTLHTFMDFRPVLDYAVALEPKTIFVHSPFNDQPVDARHFHRESGATDYQCAYSIFSKQTIAKYLESKKVSSVNFSPFEMQNDLAKNDASPLRNYHIRLDTGERYLTNGIGIIFKEYILTIKL